ncbi:MAG: hypothetical protein WBA93_17995 [Microcoleaceae cyanobacterium]
MIDKTLEKDPKVKVISAIWVCATGILGICVPLTAITDSGAALPLAIILGASGSSVVVLSVSGNNENQKKLINNVQDLEEKIVNLEASSG